jgi:primosomal protein N' (replication factor Y)
VEIIDMREEFARERKRSVLSQALQEALRRCLAKGEQAMLLLNRRGFHSFLLCRKCGEAALCPHCSISLTYHHKAQLLRCHLCDFAEPPPARCPNLSCQAERRFLQFFGEGTEQVEQMLRELLPEQVIDRLDRDSVRSLAQAETILDRFRKGQSQVLVGTQMIAKGHDFPNVTLVGILNADLGLRASDFRCAEWTFQLLTQVAGRSGRGQKAGVVLVQTFLPEHYSILCSARHDYSSFVEQEMRYRKLLFYPPFSHMLLCMVQHRHEEQARADAASLARACEPFRSRVTLLGPSAASPAKVRDVFRQQLLVKAPRRREVAELAETLLVASEGPSFSSRVLLDIDPQNFS